MTTVDAAVRPLTEAELRDWIRAHRVCWETVVHREAVREGLRSVGYDIVLCAQFTGADNWDPESEPAHGMLARLRQLADAVIPADGPDDARLAPFDHALQVRAQADWHPEMRLVLEIRHDHDYFAAIDDGERTCLGRIELALQRWGVQRDAWQEARKTRS